MVFGNHSICLVYTTIQFIVSEDTWETGAIVVIYGDGLCHIGACCQRSGCLPLTFYLLGKPVDVLTFL